MGLKHMRTLTCVAFTLATCSTALAGQMLYTNGNFYTGNANQKWAQAVVIEDGKFTFVGGADEARKAAANEAEVIDLSGKTVVPGFYDSHLHPQGAGEKMLYFCNVSAAAEFDELVSVVKGCAETMPEGAWIQGGNWGPQVMDLKDGETYKERLARLDEATQGRPMAMRDFSNHNVYVNSKAMELAGFDKKDLSEFGDLVIRDADGTMSGIFVEEAGRGLDAAVPPYTKAQSEAALKKGLDTLNGYGFIGILDSAVGEETLDLYLDLERKDQLNLHAGLSMMWEADENDLDAYKKDFLRVLAKADASKNIDTHFAKLMVDGIPPTQTAAFIEPYLNTDNVTGSVYYNDVQLKNYVTWLDAQGITAQFHTVGDRAVRVTLDAIEAARNTNGDSGRYHQLAHACLIDEADLPRFAELKAVANFSPLFWYPSPIVDGMVALLGKERASDAYCPSKTLLEDNAYPTGGSDWPVGEAVNPWEGIEAFVTRKDPNGARPDEVLSPKEIISLDEAMKLYTINGARVLGLEDTAGSIEVGKSADMVVISQNVFEVPASEINQTQTLETIFEGRSVYKAKTK